MSPRNLSHHIAEVTEQDFFHIKEEGWLGGAEPSNRAFNFRDYAPTNGILCYFHTTSTFPNKLAIKNQGACFKQRN